ncbi:MAG: hypothetical protein H6835_17345 [Planctomycetes bacterium]|nr:hypothetical protein [Planctomycetota bacterium]
MRSPITAALLALLPLTAPRAQAPTLQEARELFAIVDKFAPLDTSALPLVSVTRRSWHHSYSRCGFLLRSDGHAALVQFFDLGSETVTASRTLTVRPITLEEAVALAVAEVEILGTEEDGVTYAHYLSPTSTMHPCAEALLLARVLDRLDRTEERDRLLALALDAQKRLGEGLAHRLTIDFTDPRYTWQDLLQRHELWLATFPGHGHTRAVQKRRAQIAEVIAQLADPNTSAEKRLLLDDPWLDGNDNSEAGHLDPPVPPPTDGTRPLDRLLQGGTSAARRLIELLDDKTPSRGVSYTSRHGGDFMFEPVGELANEALCTMAGPTARYPDRQKDRAAAWREWLAGAEDEDPITLLEDRLAAGDVGAILPYLKAKPDGLPELLESIGDNQQHAMSLCSKLLQLPQTAHREAVHAASRVAAQRCYVGRWRASMVQRLCELGDREALSLVVASWRKRDLEKLEWRYQDHDDAFVEMQVLAEFADDAVWKMLAEQCSIDNVRNRLARALLTLVCERRAQRPSTPTLSADQRRAMRALLTDDSFLLEKEAVPAGNRDHALRNLQTAEGAAIWLAATRPETFAYPLLADAEARRAALPTMRALLGDD